MKEGSSKRYFNRELSWLFFNSRVLAEAKNSQVPLMDAEQAKLLNPKVIAGES